MELARLLKFGYFPKEIPPPFTTVDFGRFTKSSKFPKVSQFYTSRSCIHTLARPGNQRRVLSIPNPFNYFLLCKALSENEDEVMRQFERSTISISKPVVDTNDFRAYLPSRSGRDLPNERARIRVGGRYIVRTDISRFYHSIYTHSIPWALNGKAMAKRSRKHGFANILDKYIRNSQDAQTLGIPVGPDASFIVSELICSAIDEEIQKFDFRGIRFVDDFEFSFLTRGEAEQAIPRIESILREYELALNPLKTHIDELPMPFENPWRLRIKRFPFSGRPRSSQILEYFDLLFELHKLNRNEPVLRYGIARLKSLEFRDQQLLTNLLFQCILVEPGTLREAFFVIEKLKIRVHRDKLNDIIQDLILIHGRMKHGSEVAWALWIAILYKINLSESVINSLADFDDDIVALLTLHAYNKGLVHREVLDYWQHLMTRDSLRNGHWLLAYEANLKNWLPSADARNHIESSEPFRVLAKHNVSFYDEEVDFIMRKGWLSDAYDANVDSDEDDDKEDENDEDDGIS
jgi:hypothetical protein